MSKGSSPQNVTTTSSAEPSEFIRPYLDQAINYGQDLFEADTPNFFPTIDETKLDTSTNASLDLADSAMQDLADDTTPQLGGDLDAQTNHIGFTQQSITYNATTTTVDWGAGNKATVTLTGNVGTMAFTNPPKPSNLLLKIVQDATGSRTVTAWDSDVKWAGGTAPTLSTGASAIDIISCYFDGTSYYCVPSLEFS